MVEAIYKLKICLKLTLNSLSEKSIDTVYIIKSKDQFDCQFICMRLEFNLFLTF